MGTVTRSTETLTEVMLGQQLACLDQLGLDVLETAEVLGAGGMTYALDAASRIRQPHELAAERSAGRPCVPVGCIPNW
jgi:hypothetical protein